MKTLYLVRHGQTLFNVLHKVQGWCDSPLTDLGIKQAQTVGHYFEAEHIVLESAYCSTAERAADTLEQITDLPYQRVKGLREWYFGKFEGEPEFLNPPLPYRDFFVQYGGESEQQVQRRMAATLTKIMKQDPNHVILAVSHGGAIVNFQRYFDPGFHPHGFPNAGILKFVFEPKTEKFELLDIIDPAKEVH